MEDQRPQDARPERGSAMIAAAIIGAALILSWGVSSRAPRYQLAGAGNMVVRMDVDSGELIACNVQRCARIEAPDRAKTFGPLTISMDNSNDAAALPRPGKN